MMLKTKANLHLNAQLLHEYFLTVCIASKAPIHECSLHDMDHGCDAKN